MADDSTPITMNESIARNDLAIRKFAQIIAHDTNNYYGVIQGYISLLEMQMKGDERVEKCLIPIKSALNSGIVLNKQISSLYRKTDIMVVREKLSDLVKSAIADFTASNDFIVEVEGETEDVLLEVPTVNKLIKDLCMLAKIAGNSKARFLLDSVTLSEDEAARMILKTPGGKFAEITFEFDKVDIEQDDETLFFNPFTISAEETRDIGVGGIFGVMRNHGGNLDVASNNQTMIIKIYFPVENA